MKVSSLIENNATDKQKANGYDIADYLIEQQNKINQSNEIIDSYNAKLETVLNDESLLNDFYTILDEQKAFCHQLLHLLDPECKEGAPGELDEIRELFNLVCALA